ncbi:Epsin-3, clathrin recruitment and traffic between the Golgi and endosome, partial [Spiromyces aspiralis]
ALQLIEYLVKNGAERVIDDVRGHITIIKMLRNFYYIDPDGKDKGINGKWQQRKDVHTYEYLGVSRLRVRAKELTEFLQDNKRIKEERQKAKENRAKYISLGSNGHGSIGISSRGSNMESISSTNFDSISSGGSMSGAGSQMLGRSYGDIGSMSGGRRGR